MKFKNYIETESGIKDTSTSPGTSGQLLSSTVAGTEWIDQNTISSGTSEVVDIQVKNISSANNGINLSKGDPVYIYGSVGASPRLLVDLADADSTATNNLGDGKMPCVALLDQDLTPNQEGTATVVGKLRNLITSPIDGSTPNENDTVYVKSGGGLTLTKPTGSTNLIQNVGQVGRVSTSADGNIVVAALLRSNDVPNLPTGKIWVGDGNTIVSDVVYLDETSERMGINTANPGGDLQVVGSNTTGRIYLSADASGSSVSDSLLISKTGINSYIYNRDIGDLSFGSNDQQDYLTIKSDGDVGIGTTSPGSKLHISDATTPEIRIQDTTNNRYLSLYQNNSNSYIQSSLNSALIFATHGANERIRITTAGNVGIGTTSPGQPLHVNGNARVDGDFFIIESNPQIFLSDTNHNSDFSINLNSGLFKITDTTNSADRITLDSSGNVGIGTTSPSTNLEVSPSNNLNGVDISVSTNASQSGALFFTTGDAAEGFMFRNSNGTLGINYGAIPNSSSGATKVSINGSTGNVGIGTTNPQEPLHIYSTGAGPVRAEIESTQAADAVIKYTNTNRSYATFLTQSGQFSIYDYNAASHRFYMLTNGNIGIGTTNPSAKLDVVQSTAANGLPALHLIGPNTNSGLTSSVLVIEQGDGKKITIDGNDIDVSSGDLFINDYSKKDVTFGGQIKVTGGGAGGDSYFVNSNVGIGTTNPNSKLQVDGEIDANGGDGYRINGKPWAAESSNILRLGDWDGEGFSTSIFDETSIDVFKVKDGGAIINCDRTSTTTYGSDASLVVGGNKFSPYGAGVLTLLNNDTTSQAGDSTGLIQFAIRDDQNTNAGYTSASIKGSIVFAAGSGSSGGGVLDFLTSTGGLGASPTTRMRITSTGNVGIGTTSALAKLHVNGGIRLANDVDSPSATKAGTFRYYVSGNNSYVDMCMRTGASTYAWVNIVTNSW